MLARRTSALLRRSLLYSCSQVSQPSATWIGLAECPSRSSLSAFALLGAATAIVGTTTLAACEDDEKKEEPNHETADVDESQFDNPELTEKEKGCSICRTFVPSNCRVEFRRWTKCLSQLPSAEEASEVQESERQQQTEEQCGEMTLLLFQCGANNKGNIKLHSNRVYQELLEEMEKEIESWREDQVGSIAYEQFIDYLQTQNMSTLEYATGIKSGAFWDKMPIDPMVFWFIQKYLMGCRLWRWLRNQPPPPVDNSYEPTLLEMDVRVPKSKKKPDTDEEEILLHVAYVKDQRGRLLGAAASDFKISLEPQITQEITLYGIYKSSSEPSKSSAATAPESTKSSSEKVLPGESEQPPESAPAPKRVTYFGFKTKPIVLAEVAKDGGISMLHKDQPLNDDEEATSTDESGSDDDSSSSKDT